MHLVPPRIRDDGIAESRDAADRIDGTPRARRLRAISPEVGPFLLTLALSNGSRTIVEIGTSAGYSTLWLAVAAQQTDGRVITFEIDPAKVELARATFADAEVEDRVEMRAIDGAVGLAAMTATADLVFLDAEKEDYLRLLEPAIEALRPGGLLIADNLKSHEADLADFRDAALADPRLGGLVVPIGRGELVAVRLWP
jgi:predicted O-methyltransferase YrrM